MAPRQPDGSIAFVVTDLEMTARPAAAVPPVPVGPRLALVGASDPPASYFLYLAGEAAAAYGPTDWPERPRAELEAFLSDPKVELFTLMVDGWPGGFFVLDTRETGRCDLACFGLVPQAIGRGLSAWLLATAVHMGWDRIGAGRMTVSTSTLDHPRVIVLYQKAGFVPVARTARRRPAHRTRRPGPGGAG
jgi:GNAT superfamily N-acetyltransferase